MLAVRFKLHTHLLLVEWELDDGNGMVVDAILPIEYVYWFLSLESFCKEHFKKTMSVATCLMELKSVQ